MNRRQLLARGTGIGLGGVALATVGCGGRSSSNTTNTAASTRGSASGSPTTAGSAQSTPAPKQGGTLHATHIGPSMLPYDPHQSPAESQGIIWDTVGGTLLRSDRSLVLRPYFAQSWESPDPTTFIFKLYDGIKYESRAPVNGRQFTADDVVYNVNRANSADPKFLMAKPKFKFLDSVQAVDPLTVKFTMKKPYAPFPALMSIGFWFAAKEAIEKYGDANVPDAVRGAGPYKATQIDQANFLRLERNENYFQKNVPHADIVEATYYANAGSAAAAMISGQIDLIGNSTSQDRKQLDAAGIKYRSQNAVSSGHFSFELNTQKTPFQDARVRRALNLAVDRQALVRLSEASANAGEPLGVVAAWLQPFALPRDELYKRPGFRTPKDKDIADAKQLLSAAGYGATNPLQFDSTAWTQWSDTFAVWVQDWMKTIGVQMTIKPVDSYAGLIGAVNSKNFDTAVSGYSIGFEPDDQIYDFYYSTGLRNYTTFNDPKIDASILAQQSELDRNKRIQLIQQLQRDILDADPGLIWLHGNGVVSAMKPNVFGFENTPDTQHDYRFDQVWLT